MGLLFRKKCRDKDNPTELPIEIDKEQWGNKKAFQIPIIITTLYHSLCLMNTRNFLPQESMNNATLLFCLHHTDSLWPHELYGTWNSPGQNTGVGSYSLLQGIFLTQELNPGLQHCRRILYQLSHQGSPRILEWVVYPLSNGSSWPRSRTGVSCIALGFFTSWATREAPIYNSSL